MSIIKHELYDFYLAYLENLRLSIPQKKLMSISKTAFDEFSNKWEKEPFFRCKWEDIFKSWIRDRKLKKFLEKNGTEDFEFNSTAKIG